MTTSTLTLADFLLARIAEDEAAVEHAIASDKAPSGWLGPMRDMLDVHRALLEHGDNGEWAFDFVLRALAQPYADHPDFDPGWRA